MPANVALTNVVISKIYKSDEHTQYDGTVTLRAATERLRFECIYKFNAARSVEAAVADAAGVLKSDLDQLSVSTQQVLSHP
jgi:hypothetical protein